MFRCFFIVIWGIGFIFIFVGFRYGLFLFCWVSQAQPNLRAEVFEGILHESGAGYMFNVSDNFKKDFNVYFVENVRNNVNTDKFLKQNQPSITFEGARYYLQGNNYSSDKVEWSGLLINIHDSNENILQFKK